MWSAGLLMVLLLLHNLSSAIPCWCSIIVRHVDEHTAHHQVNIHHSEAFSQSRGYCTKRCGAKLRCIRWCNSSFNFSQVELHFLFIIFFFQIWRPGQMWLDETYCSSSCHFYFFRK